ncbi:Pyrimidine-specific ribonucleoside hydrolase RihA [subsurface metagenome]
MNTIKKISGLLLGLFIMQAGFSHYTAKYHVIVDTDGGMDDFRALCMMLASPEIEVIAITTADGILNPVETAVKVSSLLHRFGHQGIPVGIGNERPGNIDLPAGASEVAKKISWGEETIENVGSRPAAVDLIKASLSLEEMPVDFIALGPLTNIAAAIQSETGLEEGIRKIIWYSEGMGGTGLNYKMDPHASNIVARSGYCMDLISSGGSMIGNLKDFLLALDTIRSDYAKAILDIYRRNESSIMHHNMGSRLADDCIPLYLTHPEHFIVTPVGDDPDRREIHADASSDLQNAIFELLDSDNEDKSIIFNRFPTDANLFENDVAAISDQVIDKYGLKEWKIVVLTNEFHEHLGIYSIIGAKMGLRAREYFCVGIDELPVESLAGNNPPVSCLNDGLQVSTGATLGHGTIVVCDKNPSPTARFTFKNSTIEIHLKESLLKQIRDDIKTGIQEHGLDSSEYWDYIRKLALQYWIGLDRRDIFEIVICDMAGD